MDTTTATKTTTCGFCETGAHTRCPWGIANGDGSIVRCICRQCHNPENRRCTECGNRRPEEVGDAWKCLDRDACAAEQQRRIDANPLVQQMAQIRAAREAQEAAAPTRTAPSAPKSSETPREGRTVLGRPSVAGPRGCLCLCGGQTKGGKFLPGHDSKYLNALVANPGADSYRLAYDVSDAFGAKYEKRVK